jgi:hypothetical protein
MLVDSTGHVSDQPGKKNRDMAFSSAIPALAPVGLLDLDHRDTQGQFVTPQRELKRWAAGRAYG